MKERMEEEKQRKKKEERRVKEKRKDEDRIGIEIRGAGETGEKCPANKALEEDRGRKGEERRLAGMERKGLERRRGK